MESYNQNIIRYKTGLLNLAFMDTHSKWAAARLYTTKMPVTAADLLNDRVLPFFASQEMGIICMLTDRGTKILRQAGNA